MVAMHQHSVNIRVVSRDTIKPSSPTPHHLRTYKLSLLDQATPNDHIPVILFYSNYLDCSSVVVDVERLKGSLSQTLVRFFPLAGRLHEGNTLVDCSDQGVEFIHADAQGSRLSHFLSDPHLDLITRLLPCHTSCNQNPNITTRVGALLSVQVTSFYDGFTVAVCISHKVADGISMAAFLNAWATETTTFSSSDHIIINPDLTAPSLFLPIEDFPSDIFGSTGSSVINKLVSRRFVFSGPSIAELRRSAATAKGASRVELVTGVLWRSIVSSRTEASPAAMALHLVDLRRRMAPPLPTHAFGNLCTVALTSLIGSTTASEEYTNINCFEQQIRSSVRRVDAHYVRQLQGPSAMEASAEVFGMEEEVDRYSFSSWCRFPLYEVDFGHGKPQLVTPIGAPSDPQKNFIILMDARTGGGIEVWLTMEESEMLQIEKDEGIRSSASIHSLTEAGKENTYIE